MKKLKSQNNLNKFFLALCFAFFMWVTDESSTQTCFHLVAQPAASVSHFYLTKLWF